MDTVVEYPDQIHLDVAKVFHFFLLQLSLFFQEEHVQSHPQAYQSAAWFSLSCQLDYSAIAN